MGGQRDLSEKTNGIGKLRSRTPKKLGMPMFKRTFARTSWNNVREPQMKMWRFEKKKGPESSPELHHFGAPPHDTIPPPFIHALSFGGNGHRPDKSHFLRPPKVVLEGALYGTFPPPPPKNWTRRFVAPFAISKFREGRGSLERFGREGGSEGVLGKVQIATGFLCSEVSHTPEA